VAAVEPWEAAFAGEAVVKAGIAQSQAAKRQKLQGEPKLPKK